MKKVLTIAGSDSSGGAGIQADIKTICAHGMYAESVITSLTAQNTVTVSDILKIPSDFVKKQLCAVFEDIFPDSVKIGMLGEKKAIEVIADTLKQYGTKNIVVDPVMISTSGCKLISENAQNTLCKRLFPLATLITPNIPEAETLAQSKIKNETDMLTAAKRIFEQYGSAVLVKGGHLVNDATDLLYDGGSETFFTSPKINTTNTHGTGCTLSSAIACRLASGENLKKSIKLAKEYLTAALSDMLDLGKGSGPINHMYILKK